MKVENGKKIQTKAEKWDKQWTKGGKMANKVSKTADKGKKTKRRQKNDRQSWTKAEERRKNSKQTWTANRQSGIWSKLGQKGVKMADKGGEKLDKQQKNCGNTADKRWTKAA